MTSQEAKGSYMRYFDVMKYFEDNNHDNNYMEDTIEYIDGKAYLSLEMVSNRIGALAFKVMQCKVPNEVFGSIWTETEIPSSDASHDGGPDNNVFHAERPDHDAFYNMVFGIGGTR